MNYELIISLQKKIIMDALQKEREELIEMFGIHFESIYQIPPWQEELLVF